MITIRLTFWLKKKSNRKKSYWFWEREREKIVAINAIFLNSIFIEDDGNAGAEEEKHGSSVVME